MKTILALCVPVLWPWISHAHRAPRFCALGALSRLFIFSIFLFPFSFPSSSLAWAQFKDQTPAGEAPGPWIFATIGVGKKADKTPETTALKGLALKVGEHGEASVCYDLDLCRMAGAWTGGKFVTPMNLMSRGEYPTALGETTFLSNDVAGFRLGRSANDQPETLAQYVLPPWRDPRSEPFGPLPGLRYQGMIVNGPRFILKWKAGETEILESPWFELRDGCEVFERTFEIAPSDARLWIALCKMPGKGDLWATLPRGSAAAVDTLGADWIGLPPGSRWTSVDGQLAAEIPPHRERIHFRLLWGFHLKPSTLSAIVAESKGNDRPLSATIPGETARWPEAVATSGEITAQKDEPYVVDTIRVPDPNPWNAPMFISGFDFFPDGRAAVCTFHGDVFIISGLDAKLDHVTWKRFAAGLYHPLGLKIVHGEIYVTGRDGITRLRDLHQRGEADSYDVFNWDIKVTKNFHEFVFDLQTDPAGNFYFAKAGPVKNGGRGFDQICDHHGCLFRVTPDGKALTVMATGFRAPNGIGVGPESEITSGDNEGTWTPACRINWINQGGFYGVVPLAHWPETPREYEKPICWLPKRVDNSSGSQIWVTSDQWGPWKGRMLHLSYGQCALFGVMMEGVDAPDAPDCCSHLMQGGVVKFPLKFQSGIMRARFNPVDGQLYVAGLRGWQTTALKNGCLQRVRYTGAPVRMPLELEAKKTGISVKFSCSLDTQKAADPENWNVEVWNYIWSSAYGSPEISTLGPGEQPAERGKDGEAEYTPGQMQQRHHDPLEVKSATVGTDDRTVFLEIPNLKPVMQMSIKYQLKSADGKDLDGEIVNTINALPTE